MPVPPEESAAARRRGRVQGAATPETLLHVPHLELQEDEIKVWLSLPHSVETIFRLWRICSEEPRTVDQNVCCRHAPKASTNCVLRAAWLLVGCALLHEWRLYIYSSIDVR